MGKDSRNRLCHTPCCFQPSVHCPPSPPPPSPAIECQREPAGGRVCPSPGSVPIPSSTQETALCRLPLTCEALYVCFLVHTLPILHEALQNYSSHFTDEELEWLRNWPENTEPLSGRFASPPSAVLLETDPPMTAGFSWFPSQAKEKFRDSEVSGKRKVSVLL